VEWFLSVSQYRKNPSIFIEWLAIQFSETDPDEADAFVGLDG